MVLALLLAVVPVALGTALALLPLLSAAALPVIRLGAMLTAGAVVVLHLLPEAYAELGLTALLLCAAGFALPHLLERWTWRERGDRAASRLTLGLGLAGLCLHQVADGVGFFVFTATAAAAPEVAVALGIHTVPVASVVVLRALREEGRRAALLSGLGMALATVAGVVGAAALGGERFAGVQAWIGPIAGGLLLHIIAHDSRSQLLGNGKDA